MSTSPPERNVRMTNEMIYFAKAKTNTAKKVLFGLLGTSVLLIVATYLTKKYSGIIWVLALGFITATIYVYNKYVASEYRYEIVNFESKPVFTVSMRVGKTERTMARLDLCDVTEIRKMSRDEYRLHKCDKGVLRYSYFPTMFAKEVYFICVRSEYENADVFIEIDEAFAAKLEFYRTV